MLLLFIRKSATICEVNIFEITTVEWKKVKIMCLYKTGRGQLYLSNYTKFVGIVNNRDMADIFARIRVTLATSCKCKEKM